MAGGRAAERTNMVAKAVGTLPLSDSNVEDRIMTKGTPSRTLPIACSLDAAGIETRRVEFQATVGSQVSARKELSDGIEMEFAPGNDLLPALARFIEDERKCCQFLRFTITVEEGGGPISLGVRGPAGSGEFIRSLITA